jgi:hypothetical protein
MTEQVVGRIEFGNTREGCALETLREALVDKAMWMNESMKKDEEIERLKKLLAKRRSHGVQKPR